MRQFRLPVEYPLRFAERRTHGSVATALGYLAELCRAQGRDADAEHLSMRSQGIKEKALAPDNPRR